MIAVKIAQQQEKIAAMHQSLTDIKELFNGLQLALINKNSKLTFIFSLLNYKSTSFVHDVLIIHCSGHRSSPKTQQHC